MSRILNAHSAVAAVATLAAATALLTACSDDAVTPSADECEPETSTVTPIVTTGEVVTFEWDPSCGVALLLVEEGASDQWGINTPEDSWETASEANLILPPVTYGLAPEGVEEDFPAEELVAGRTYELVLWRILPEGTTGDCIMMLENACLLAVHEFTR